ncbi:MAG TPA: hypothetical protein VIK94_00845, partial [Bacilli bacterium]
MKKFFKNYLWLWEFIAVAFVLAIGIVAKFIPDILIIIIGITFIVLGIFRIIPLLKTTKDRLLKGIYAGEIFISIFAGAVLIYLYYQKEELNKTFGYIIGAVLYLRALIYFYGTILRHEESDFFQFILHIVLITLGT